jgi:periplasmic protein TonB
LCFVVGSRCNYFNCFRGNEQTRKYCSAKSEITLLIELAPESVVPVVTEKLLVAAESKTISIASVPVEPLASPPTDTQKSVLPEVIPIIATPVGKLVSAEAPQASSGLVATAAAPSTNVPIELIPALAGESKGCAAAYLTNPRPIYPKEALKRKQEGLVVLSVLVAAGGKPQLVEILQSSGHPLLDEAAIQVVKKWRFTPARIGSTQVISRVEVPIRFKLANNQALSGF